PRRLVTIAAGRLDERGDGLERRRAADDGPGPADAGGPPLQGTPGARRRRRVPQLAATAAHEGQMLGPRLRLDGADPPRDGVEPTGVDRRRRGQSERHAVQDTGTWAASVRSARSARPPAPA